MDNGKVNSTSLRYLYIFLGLAFSISIISEAHEEIEPDIHIREYVFDSEFIFKGQVEQIDYRSSQPVTGVDLETGEPVLLDGSTLPHTFVKFSIDRIYKGNPPQLPSGGPDTHLILRFAGGVASDDPNLIMFVDTFPLFDPNDRVVLFVQGNEVKDCPLIQDGYGCLWLLPESEEIRATIRVYNVYGHELNYIAGSSVPPVTPDEASFGPFHDLGPININTIGGHTIQRVTVDPNDEFSLPDVNDQPLPDIILGPQFDESGFDLFLDQIVAEVHTPSELAALPPINSADPDQLFFAGIYTDNEPNSPETEIPPEISRAWLDQLDPNRREAFLEQERMEAHLFELTDADPVLPETPCEIQQLENGPLLGDLSGPEGKPDCYVDLFDLQALAGKWLLCNDPDQPACI